MIQEDESCPTHKIITVSVGNIKNKMGMLDNGYGRLRAGPGRKSRGEPRGPIPEVRDLSEKECRRVGFFREWPLLAGSVCGHPHSCLTGTHQDSRWLALRAPYPNAFSEYQFQSLNRSGPDVILSLCPATNQILTLNDPSYTYLFFFNTYPVKK